MVSYFRKLPVIHYANNFARNILARTAFTKETKDNQTLFYPYTMKESDSRLDVISHRYYKDADLTWLICMTNDILDPYYGAGVTEQEMISLVETKYGNVAAAYDTIVHWRNDWSADDSLITPAAYDNLLDGQKKYWTHVSNYDGTIIGYERKKEDWVVDTNKIVEVTIDTNENISEGDKITQASTNSTAIVAWSNTTSLTLKHVQGPLANGAVTTASTNTSITIVNTTEAIPSEEILYWTPVSAYEWEFEKNKQARDIRLLDKRMVDSTSKQLDRLLDDLD